MTRLTSTRLPEKMSTDRADLDAILDASFLGHLAYVDEGRPVVFPTSVVRWGELLLVHGSTGSRWMRRVAEGADVCVSVASVEGIVVARSAFESSVIYRSAMIFGSFTPVVDGLEEALQALTERLIPGRVAEVRPSTPKELAATLLLQMPLERWSVRISDEMPDDPAEDVAGSAWAGQVRYAAPSCTIVPAPDLLPGTPVPPSVSGYAPRP